MKVVNLAEAFGRIDDHWRPRIGGKLNDYVVKLVKFKGDFVWHTHSDTDELFLVHKGRMTVRFREGKDVSLSAGEFFIVPRGLEHITVAEEECEVLVIEPDGTRNTGNVLDAARTALEEPAV